MEAAPMGRLWKPGRKATANAQGAAEVRLGTKGRPGAVAKPRAAAASWDEEGEARRAGADVKRRTPRFAGQHPIEAAPGDGEGAWQSGHWHGGKAGRERTARSDRWGARQNGHEHGGKAGHVNEGRKRTAPEKPDHATFETAIGKIDAEVQELRTRMQELDVVVSRQTSKLEDIHGRKAKLRADLDAASEHCSELQQKKEAVLRGDDEGRRSEELQRIKELKGSIGFSSERQIVDRIADIENQLWNERLPLSEEKKLLSEIAVLNSKKPQVARLREMEAKVNAADDGQILKARVDAISEEIRTQRERKKALVLQYQEFMQEGKQEWQQYQASESLHEQEEAKRRLGELLQERTRLEERFKQQECEFNAWHARQRQREEEELQERERQARLERVRQDQLRPQEGLAQKRQADEEAEKAPEAAKSSELAEEPPHFHEVCILEQTLQFCLALMPKQENKEDQKKEVQYNNPEGSEIIIPKEHRSMDYLVAPTKPRRNEGKVYRKPHASKLKQGRIEGCQPITHNYHSFALFEELKMDAPVSTDDLPATIQNIEERLEVYRGEIGQREEKRKEAQRERREQENAQARQAERDRAAQEEKMRAEAVRAVNVALEELRSSQGDECQEAATGCMPPLALGALEELIAAAAAKGAGSAELAGARQFAAGFRREEAKATLLAAADALAGHIEEGMSAREPAADEQREDRTEEEQAAAAWIEEKRRKELKQKLKAVRQAAKAAEAVGVDAELIEIVRAVAKREAEAIQAAENDRIQAAAPKEATNDESREEAKEALDQDDFEPTMVVDPDNEDEITFDLGM